VSRTILGYYCSSHEGDGIARKGSYLAARIPFLVKGRKCNYDKQEVLGRTTSNALPFFDTIHTSYKTKRISIEDTYTHKQQGDIISLLTKIRGDTQTDTDGYTDTQTDSEMLS
jgi:hypothetical protein